MYILIMTFILSYPSASHLSVATAEFSSEQACRYAGAQQELAIRNDLQRSTKQYTFICVPQ